MLPGHCFQRTADDVKNRLCALAMKSILTHNIIINFTTAVRENYYEIKKNIYYRYGDCRHCAFVRSSE